MSREQEVVSGVHWMVSAVACVVARLESRGAVEIGRPLVVIRKWAVVKAPMGTAGLTNRHHESEKTKVSSACRNQQFRV